MSKIPERFTWAADLMNIQPGDNILEIGCGAGILAEQIAGRLDTGKFVAVDQSPAMIRMAAKRNSRFISTGKATFITGDFKEAKIPGTGYDKIAAFNVNFFWKDPAQELSVIKRLLQPSGLLYIFYQAPYDIDINAAIPVKEKLTAHSFTVADTLFKKMNPTSAFCIVATINERNNQS